MRDIDRQRQVLVFVLFAARETTSGRAGGAHDERVKTERRKSNFVSVLLQQTAGVGRKEKDDW